MKENIETIEDMWHLPTRSDARVVHYNPLTESKKSERAIAVCFPAVRIL